MMKPPPPLYFHRTEPAKNMARFYGLSIEPTLFGEVALVRVWGRIGTRGRMRLECHAGEADALRAFARETARRLLRGYAPAE